MSLPSSFEKKKKFIWLQQAESSIFTMEHGSLVAACRIQFPDEGSIPGPLPWERDGVPAIGPLVKSQILLLYMVM